MTSNDTRLNRILQALERTALATERIADVLELLVDVEMPAAAAEAPTCPHPDDQRVSLGMTQGRPDWTCRACGYHSLEASAEEIHG